MRRGHPGRVSTGQRMGSQLKDALKALGFGRQKETGTSGRSPVARSVAKPGNRAEASEQARRISPGMKPSLGAAQAPVARHPVAPPRHARPSGGNANGLSRKTASPNPEVQPSGGSPRQKMPAPTAPPAPASRPQSRLLLIGEFRPNPLFVDDPSELSRLPALDHNGIARQLTESPDNETDLVIGLDFGTSATKVVIRDAFAATSVFPVQFYPDRQGIDGYLIPSRVYRTGRVYSLAEGTDRIADLKLSLLACPAKFPVTEFDDCCAFLALVIRRARGWLLSRHRDIYRRHALNWRLNLGLAARSYQDDATVTMFRRLAWAAANLAADDKAQTITSELVEQYRQLSLLAVKEGSADGFQFGWNDVDAVPEVSAQLQGFMSSARWNWQARPVMMLVDVGAGTVDSALFHVRVPASGSGVLTFYASRVEPNGVMNLHRERIGWLRRMLPQGGEHAAAGEYLASIARPTDRLRPVPDAIGDYLPGYEIELRGRSVDDEFWTDRYRRQIAGSINDAKVGKGIPASQLERIPLLLCGGGSRMGFYKRIGDAINRTAGWHVSVDEMRLPVPQDLVDGGWHADDFDRLSVAYGLSLAGQGDTTLGRIVRSIEVPDVRPYQKQDRDDLFVSKDQM